MALWIGGVGEDVARAEAAVCVHAQDGAGGAAGHVEPDGLAGGGERGVRQGQAERFADDLRGGGGAEELAAAAGRGAGAAADLGGVFERDLLLGEAGADGLDLAGVFAVVGQQRDAAGDEDGWAVAPAEASAIIMAGRPLSQVATPRTPLRVGSERIRRRRTMAASLR